MKDEICPECGKQTLRGFTTGDAIFPVGYDCINPECVYHESEELEDDDEDFDEDDVDYDESED